MIVRTRNFTDGSLEVEVQRDGDEATICTLAVKLDGWREHDRAESYTVNVALRQDADEPVFQLGHEHAWVRR